MKQIKNELHPLVREFQSLAMNKKPDLFDRGLIRLSKETALNIKVSPQLLSRAVDMVNDILQDANGKGWGVSIGKGYDGYETQVEIEGEKVAIELDEKLRMEKRVPKKGDKYFWGGHDWIPTGMLRLRITNACFSGLRQNWMDGKSRKLEDALSGFLIGLQKSAQYLKARRINNEEEKRQRLEEQQKLELVERHRQLEEQVIEDLKLKVSNWEMGKLVHTYLDDLLNQFDHRKEVLNDPRFQAWLNWARGCADKLKLPTEFVIPAVSNFSGN